VKTWKKVSEEKSYEGVNSRDTKSQKRSEPINDHAPSVSPGFGFITSYIRGKNVFVEEGEKIFNKRKIDSGGEKVYV